MGLMQLDVLHFVVALLRSVAQQASDYFALILLCVPLSLNPLNKFLMLKSIISQLRWNYGIFFSTFYTFICASLHWCECLYDFKFRSSAAIKVDIFIHSEFFRLPANNLPLPPPRHVLVLSSPSLFFHQHYSMKMGIFLFGRFFSLFSSYLSSWVLWLYDDCHCSRFSIRFQFFSPLFVSSLCRQIRQRGRLSEAAKKKVSKKSFKW